MRSPARCPHGALTVIAVGTWNSGSRRRHAKNLATSIAWPPPRPMTLAAPGQAVERRRPGRRQLERVDEVDAGEVRPGERGLEQRPQVGHRDHEVRRVDEVRQLADQTAPEHGAERPPASASGRVIRGWHGA